MKTDTGLYLPPNYDTMQPPPVGQSYADPVFGTRVRRLTDAMNTVDSAMGTGVKLTSITSEYSSVCSFNANSSKLLLQHGSYFSLYDGAGKFIADIREGGRFPVNSASEPRWDVKDPNKFYFLSKNALMSWDVAASKSTLLKQFSEYLPKDSEDRNGVRAMGEGDLSLDGQYWALAGTVLSGAQEIFLFDLKNQTKGKTLKTAGPNKFDSIYATPDGNVTVTWFASGTGRYQGIELYDKNMQFLRQVARSGGHMDVGRDTNGDEVLIWQCSADPGAPKCPNSGIVKIRLADASQTCILPLTWNLSGTHTYCPATPGWAVITTELSQEQLPWEPYRDEVIKLSMDGKEVQRLCHHRSRPMPPPHDYQWQPKATGNRDLSKILFNSNFNLPRTAAGVPTGYADTYLIDSAASPVLDRPPSEGMVLDALEVEGFHKVDFSNVEGRQYAMRFTVKNGKLETEMWEK